MCSHRQPTLCSRNVSFPGFTKELFTFTLLHYQQPKLCEQKTYLTGHPVWRLRFALTIENYPYWSSPFLHWFSHCCRISDVCLHLPTTTSLVCAHFLQTFSLFLKCHMQLGHKLLLQKVNSFKQTFSISLQPVGLKIGMKQLQHGVWLSNDFFFFKEEKAL